MPDSQNVAERVEKFVRTDWIDLRDYPYKPSLAVLKRELLPAKDRLPHLVRDQGAGARCTGHALANLIDLQRRSVDRDHADLAADEMVSADMLYRMGAFHDDLPVIDKETLRDPSRRTGHFRDRPEGLRSLRSVLKGFYHHGVCLDMPSATSHAEAKRRWRSDCFVPDQQQSRVQVFPTVEQAKAARAISLGAFYRLQPILNDYHAALNDTGGILVSAQTHPGWLEPFDGRDEIGALRLDTLDGSHAFAIVGYTHEGFLVLNSWGDRWGSGTEWPPGVALWRYSDWAKTVMDGWVLRLGVSAPDAFDLAAGEQGWMRTMGLIKAASPRSSQLLGHYLHLDDGFHVEHGSFPSDATTWQVTRQHLRKVFAPGAGDDRKGLLLWIPGSVEGLEDAARAALGRNAEARALKLYPYTFFWSHLFADKSIEVLTSVFASWTGDLARQKRAKTRMG